MLITIFPRSNAMVFLKNNCSLVLYWHYIANNVCLFFILVVVHSIETWIWVMNVFMKLFTSEKPFVVFLCFKFEMKIKKEQKYKRFQVSLFVLGGPCVAILFWIYLYCKYRKKTPFLVYSIKSLSTHMKDFAECCGMVPPFLNPIWSMYISHFMPNVFQRSNRFYLYIFSFDILLRKK